MQKIIFKVMLFFHVLLWISLSAVNYIGIMQQLNEDIVSIFLWSIFTIMMYGVVIYSITMVMTRIYLMYQFRNSKMKYINRVAFGRLIFLLIGVILYLYGLCYYNSNYLGLLPMFLFFGKALTSIGRFYVYENNYLRLVDDSAKEYLVKDINLQEGKIAIQGMNTRDLNIKELIYKKHTDESKFLTDLFNKEVDEKEVA